MVAVRGIGSALGVLSIGLFASAGCKPSGSLSQGTDGTDAGADAAGPASCPAPAPGPSWTELPAPPPEVAGLTVTDVWPAGQDDFFFAGSFPERGADAGAAAGPGCMVLRWTHGCWTVEVMQPTATAVWPRIAGTSPTDVWLTATDTIYHRDAAGWTAQDDAWQATITPLPLYGTPRLTDVQPRTGDEVWFTTSYAVLRLSNGKWQSWELTSGQPDAPASITWFFSKLWVAGPDDVWAAGGSDQVSNTMDPAALYHFDGTSWSFRSAGIFGVYDLWPAAAEGQFWLAVPVSAENLNTIGLSATTALTPAPIAGWHGTNEVVSLWGRSPTDVWAAGQDVAHYDGTTWTEVPGTPDAVRDINHVYSDSLVTGDATATWLVGRGPRFFRQAAP